MKAPALRVQGLIMLLITAASWGINWPVLKFGLTEWPPFLFRVLSGSGAVALLLLVAVARREGLMPRHSEWGRLIAAAVLNITSWMGLATFSLFWLAASEAAIIAYTMPVWAALFAWPILGERPTWPRVVGLALGLTGVAVLMAGQLLAAPMSDLLAKLPGVACIMGTALMFAAGAVVTKRWPVTLAPVPLVAWQLAIGMAPMLLLSLIFERWSFAAITPLGWGAAIYVGVVAMCVSYLAWFRALKLLPASTATVGTLLVPVIGVLSAAAALGEPLGARHAIAMVLTIAGVLLASRG